VTAIIYIIVSALATGIVSYKDLEGAEALAHALRMNGSTVGVLIVSVGAVCGMTTVLLMQMYGMSRIFYVMSRDGMMPEILVKLNKRNSPSFSVALIAILLIVLAGFFPFDLIGQMASMAGLLDYATVSLIAIILRLKYPDIERKFRCPAIFALGPMAFISCFYLMYKQAFQNGEIMLIGKVFVGWLVAFTIFYFVITPFISNNKSET
jgi:APA family basic amino acid/polyamine antiporter